MDHKTYIERQRDKKAKISFEKEQSWKTPDSG